MNSALMRHVHGTDENHKVTTLELFFDLVFVFAITQVTQLMADDPTGRGALRGVLLLALLWFAWASFAWLGNTAKADEGLLRLCLVVAVIAMFVVALAVPEAFGDRDGGLHAPLLLAIAYFGVRLAHLMVYLVVAAEDRGLRQQLYRTLASVGTSGVLLVVGAVAPGQVWWWLAAIIVDYGGMYLAGASGWRLPSPSHFAERHGLIMIVAIGESMVSIGLGISDTPVTFPILVASMFGVAVAVSLWWLYFDVVALVAERVLSDLPESERPRLARDSYSYLHFPMVAGIVFLALGMKKVLTYVSDTAHHDLGDALTGMPLYALYGGTVVYLLGHIGFRLRNVHSLSKTRATTAAVLLLSVPVMSRVPALGALGFLSAVLVVLVAYEAWHYSTARDDIRHAAH